jgi:hypothetical protein
MGRPVQIYLKTNWTGIAVKTHKKNNVDFGREGAAQMLVSYYKTGSYNLPTVTLFTVCEEAYNNVNRKHCVTYWKKTES